MRPSCKSLTSLLAFAATVPGFADEVAVAVAANFHAPMLAIAEEITRDHDIEIKIISGSTGSLYAQIVNGAPYEVFIAADQKRPTLLGKSGAAVAESQITIAAGQLVLWSSNAELLSGGDLSALRDSGLRFLAIANPDVAPYGEAARQALMNLDVWDFWQGRLVYGLNIAQAYAMAATGNAELALIARSQLPPDTPPGSYAILPRNLYEPIYQDAILLHRGAGNRSAVELMNFLRSREGKDIIKRFGYESPD